MKEASETYLKGILEYAPFSSLSRSIADRFALQLH